MPRKKKIKSGRECAIDMLKNILAYKQADAPKKWIDGMIVAHTRFLVQSCYNKTDANRNQRQIPKEVKLMIRDRLFEECESQVIQMLYESCLNYNIVDPEPDTEEIG